jgi:hypothetical protein
LNKSHNKTLHIDATNSAASIDAWREPSNNQGKNTEIKLKIWRGGQPSAERLAGNILHLDGFSSLDPQCSLGGPDGERIDSFKDSEINRAVV